MSISGNIEDKRSSDIIERTIFEKKIRIESVENHFDHGFLLIVLNNGNVIKILRSQFPRLKNANQKNLDNFNLIAGGVGVEWPALDEHLSLKGMVESIIRKNTLDYLTGKDDSEKVLG
ncbi:DUF2442 domain-containing protein [Halocola ammonii]